MKKTIGFLMLGAALGLMSPAALAECKNEISAVKNAVAAEKSKVLEIVSSKVSEAPECAGAIVKAAIQASEADSKMVAAIVEAAATVAPDQLSKIVESAVSVAPDAINEVQVFVAKRGDSKGVIDSKQAIVTEPSFNPLDFPGVGIGPNGAYPAFSVGGPLFTISQPLPDDINPPVVTDTDPNVDTARF